MVIDMNRSWQRLNRASHAVAVAVVLLAVITTPVAAQTETGLDFPGSAAVSSTPGTSPRTMRFRFPDPHLHGLPIYGPNGAGVTYIWHALVRQQAGYYTAFFWGNDDGLNDLRTFLWADGGRAADSYYGAHPYPQVPPKGSTHNWEVSVEQNDYVNGAVQYGRWHTQALRVWADAQGRKHHEFYWDLPNVDAAHRVDRVSGPTWGNRNPPAPALTWGDAPWAPGNEVWSGVLRGIQIYDTALSLPDILSELGTPGSTAAGQNALWYLNLNPTPGDISDKSGRGHHPAWVGSQRPSLYVGGTLPAPLSVTLNQTTFRRSDTLVVTVHAVAGVVTLPIDAYVVLDAGGPIFSLQLDGRLVPGLVPLARGVVVPTGSATFGYPLSGAPPGAYTWIAGLTATGTLSLASPLVTTPFTIVP